MVNKDPGEIDGDELPEIREPVARETHDNLLVGVYRTPDGYTLQVRDWANRVVEATVYLDGVTEPELRGGVEYRPLDAPEDMEAEAYLKELLKKRVEALEEETAVEGKN